MGSMFPWSTQNLHLDSQKILWYPLHPAFTGFLPAGLQHQGRCRTQCCRVELFSRPLRPLRGVGTWERYGTLRSNKHQLLTGQHLSESTFRSKKNQDSDPNDIEKYCIQSPLTAPICNSSFCIAYKSYCVNALNAAFLASEVATFVLRNTNFAEEATLPIKV